MSPPASSPSIQSRLLACATTAIDTLIEAAAPHRGLFPSILDLDGRQMPDELPDPIPGQRTGDRSFRGSNLMHDAPLLGAMYGLAEAIDRAAYREAADAYLRRFAEHCTDTPSGLFPWGEHAFWQLDHDRVGSSHDLTAENQYPRIHDHLRQAPAWLWRKLNGFNPACVRRFAIGLDWHLKAGDPPEYSRHACLDAGDPDLPPHRVIDAEGRPRRLTGPKDSSADFPRHCGFYLFDSAMALSLHPGDAELRDRVAFWSDYWWRHADPMQPLLPMTSRPIPEAGVAELAPMQTHSLGLSMLESADLLDGVEPALAGVLRERGVLLTRALFVVPHDPDAGRWWVLWHERHASMQRAAPIWGSHYGYPALCYLATQCLAAHRLTDDGRFLASAKAMARTMLGTPPPADAAIPAMDAGLTLAMLADLYDLTEEPAWRDAGLRLAGDMVERFFDRRLPRAAQGYGFYDSQTGPAYLLHGVLRLALLAEHGPGGPVGPDYTVR